MSATTDRVLTGARWSSAVRCPARATYQGLNTEPTNDVPRWLDKAYDRGVPVGEIWGLVQGQRLRDQGHDIALEMPVPWGPPEYEWLGHADIYDATDATIDEAYHSALLEFREEKALQAAGYAIGMQRATGKPHRAVLTAINTADGDRENGMAIKRYPVNVEALAPRVLEIQARVVMAVALGEVNPADKISPTPNHPECKACVFANTCHAGYQPPPPQDIVGLEDTFDALRVTDADRKATAASLKRINERRDDLLEQISEYVPENQAIRCGDVTVKRTTVAGGLSFSLTDALKAGHALPDELAAFAKTRKGYDKWEIQT